MEAAQLLKRLRMDKGLSAKDLQFISGVSVSAISRWERGERIPDVQRFEQVLNALGAQLVIVK